MEVKTAKIDNHELIAQKGIKDIYTSRKYSDILLITSGQRFRCHRILLYAFVLKWCRSLITLSPHSTVFVGNLDGLILDKILMLIYLGRTEMDLAFYPSFKAQLKNLEVRGLYDEITVGSSITIRMKNHGSLLVGAFEECFYRKYFSDISVIAAENQKSIEAHRLVLSLFCKDVNKMIGEEEEGPICSFYEEKYVYNALNLIYVGFLSARECDLNSNIFQQAFRSFGCHDGLEIENSTEPMM